MYNWMCIPLFLFEDRMKFILSSKRNLLTCDILVSTFLVVWTHDIVDEGFHAKLVFDFLLSWIKPTATDIPLTFPLK